MAVNSTIACRLVPYNMTFTHFLWNVLVGQNVSSMAQMLKYMTSHIHTYVVHVHPSATYIKSDCTNKLTLVKIKLHKMTNTPIFRTFGLK